MENGQNVFVVFALQIRQTRQFYFFLFLSRPKRNATEPEHRFSLICFLNAQLNDSNLL